MNRQNVPMLGDEAAALQGGLHEVDQVKPFTISEAAVLKFALLSFVHVLVDFDGHGANDVMMAERRRTLDPKVFASKQHCRNHATGLCGACTVSAVDEKFSAWHYNCSTFLHTSGLFFRLVQTTAECVMRFMDSPTGNMSPKSEAEGQCHQEIRDCITSNWNALDEATMRTDAWRSDAECEPLPHRLDRARMQRRRECIESESSGIANGTSRMGRLLAVFFPGPL